MAQFTGVAKIKIDGELLQSKPGAKLTLGGKKRTSKTGHAVYGYSEEATQSMLDVTVFHQVNTPVDVWRDVTDATVQFTTDTDVTYVISTMWVTDSLELTDGEGEVTLKLEGIPATKQ